MALRVVTKETSIGGRVNDTAILLLSEMRPCSTGALGHDISKPIAKAGQGRITYLVSTE